MYSYSCVCYISWCCTADDGGLNNSIHSFQSNWNHVRKCVYFDIHTFLHKNTYCTVFPNSCLLSIYAILHILLSCFHIERNSLLNMNSYFIYYPLTVWLYASQCFTDPISFILHVLMSELTYQCFATTGHAEANNTCSE